MAESLLIGAERAAFPFKKMGQDLIPRPLGGDLPVGQHDNFIGNLQNPLLVGDDQNGGTLDFPAELEKHLDEVIEAPQVDPGLRLVKNSKLGFAAPATWRFQAA